MTAVSGWSNRWNTTVTILSTITVVYLLMHILTPFMHAYAARLRCGTAYVNSTDCECCENMHFNAAKQIGPLPNAAIRVSERHHLCMSTWNIDKAKHQHRKCPVPVTELGDQWSWYLLKKKKLKIEKHIQNFQFPECCHSWWVRFYSKNAPELHYKSWFTSAFIICCMYLVD